MQTFQEYAAAGMGIAFHAKNIPHKKAVVSEHGERTFQELNENSVFLMVSFVLPIDLLILLELLM